MKWLVYVPVKEVDGHQCFKVDAETEEEAIQNFKKGEGVYDSEELEVLSLDDWAAYAEKADDK